MKTLYDETGIGSLKLKNRVFRAAIGDVNGTDGYYSEADLARYRELADGNIGLIITGEADVSDYQLFEGGKSISIQDDRYIDSLKRLTGMIHEHGGKMMIQLVHYGAETFMQGVDVIAPSDVPIPFTQQKPRPMTLDDISRVVGDFGKAARRAEIAGFDGIEIHAGFWRIMAPAVRATVCSRPSSVSRRWTSAHGSSWAPCASANPSI